MGSEISARWTFGPFSPGFLPMGVFSNFVRFALCQEDRQLIVQ